MSALAAIWRSGATERVGHDCAEVLAAQAMLGETAQDLRCMGDIALGRCLNAVLPEDRFDCQPLIGGDGQFLLVADIRLDNREQLSEALGISAGQTAQMADAAFALAAWDRWGMESFARLAGDWAIALWDERRQEMVLARDPTGMRPLHFYRRDGLLAVATLPRGLHAMADIPRELDRDFLAAGVMMAERPADHCNYRGVRRVVPGHAVRIDATSCRNERFWHPPDAMLRLPSHEDYAQAVREELDRAVAARLRGLTDVATQLSGGLDSSAVTESAARQHRGVGRITAYTARPRAGYKAKAGSAPGRFVDEWPRAAALADLHEHIDHVAVRPTPRSILDALEHHSWLAERPAIAPSNLPWILAINDRARADGHAVMLTGQTGNLTFSHSGDMLHAQRLRRLQLLALWRDLSQLPGSNVAPALLHAVKQVLPPWLQAAIDTARFGNLSKAVRPELRLSMSSRRRSRSLDRRAELMRYFENVDYGAVMKAHLGGSGMEYRDPTADRRLIELCLSIPEEQFLYQGQKRALARTVLEGRMPDVIRLETGRGLQGADWHEALAEDAQRITELLAQMAEDAVLSNLLDIGRLQQDMAQLPQDDTITLQSFARYHTGLLRGLSLASFVDQANRPALPVSSR